MTRKRAIRIAEKWSEGRVCTLREGEAQEYHKMCLAALREQEERSKGCEFCNEKNVAVMSASILTFDLKHRGCTCRFCPMCGRKLEVEE